MPACRACGAPITFWRTASGRYEPHDADRVPHRVTCVARPQAPDPLDVCLACRSLEVSVATSTGPHYARMRCDACGAQRWLPWPTRPPRVAP
jgi:hypothetical protein